jgi:hypothetical protein
MQGCVTGYFGEAETMRLPISGGGDQKGEDLLPVLPAQAGSRNRWWRSDLL